MANVLMCIQLLLSYIFSSNTQNFFTFSRNQTIKAQIWTDIMFYLTYATTFYTIHNVSCYTWNPVYKPLRLKSQEHNFSIFRTQQSPPTHKHQFCLYTTHLVTATLLKYSFNMGNQKQMNLAERGESKTRERKSSLLPSTAPCSTCLSAQTPPRRMLRSRKILTWLLNHQEKITECQR